MDMDYMDPFRRRYPNVSMQPIPQPFAGHQQMHHPQGAQYPYWNPLMAYYQQQHRTAALMGQAGMHLTKPAEPKPRLAKDEVELLEREFAKNQKPSSSTKRELAEQMGVEVPRINNWFQNRRAKEKQIKKTAEFEAQQARERAASEAKSTGSDREQGGTREAYEDEAQSPSSVAPTATLETNEDTASDNYAILKSEPVDPVSLSMVPTAPVRPSPASSDSDGFVHLDYRQAAHHTQPSSGLTAQGDLFDLLGEIQGHHDFQQPAAPPFQLTDTTLPNSLPHNIFAGISPHNNPSVPEAGDFGKFSDEDYFTTPSAPRFPSELVVASGTPDADSPLLRHQASVESLVHSDIVSPGSIPDMSPLALSNLRFKSPPPPADIASRRKSRRPAPLGLSSLMGGAGPKTGVEVPRRADTVSPMRRISSSTGLSGRVQKAFIGPNGPRSPFAMDRNKEALLHSLHETQPSTMPLLNSGMPQMTGEVLFAPGTGDGAVAVRAPDEEQGFPFGSFGAIGGIPTFNHTDQAIKSPPETPGLQIGLQESYFPGSNDNTWTYTPQDGALPTPSLCSHGGSEMEFSAATQRPGYVASQPATPSFPPTMGPAYSSFFGMGLGQTDYQFPDAYAAESSSRSSPVAFPRSKQFQFAQNVTPQDFSSTDKP
ncbi:uncharacterized protein C8A04DRAFT_29050 [Dichotomopilus funicola]|uniref:Homeobox domain-containing protein n=1 Tax=Dichotomopilus funicola TaxID=1934379 RepID=A0AAN6V394_9PEZI|nr:hypothetical protein C8A04DRAFT_29050 [Dichotomopilus funicola]